MPYKFNPFTGNFDYYESGSGAVSSVNGQTGAVVLGAIDVGAEPALGYTPVPDTRTVNGHALSADVVVTAPDVGITNATGGLYALTELEYIEHFGAKFKTITDTTPGFSNVGFVAPRYTLQPDDYDGIVVFNLGSLPNQFSSGGYEIVLPSAYSLGWKFQLMVNPDPLGLVGSVIFLCNAPPQSIGYVANGAVWSGLDFTYTSTPGQQADVLEFVYNGDMWIVTQTTLINYMSGMLPWSRVDLSGSRPGWNEIDKSTVNNPTGTGTVLVDGTNTPYNPTFDTIQTPYSIYRFATDSPGMEVAIPASFFPKFAPVCLALQPSATDPLLITANGTPINDVASITLTPGGWVMLIWQDNGWYVVASNNPALTRSEPTLGNPASDGMVLISTSAGVRSWITQEQLMPPTYATQYDDTGTGTAYVGEAAPGTAASASVWRIKLLTFSGDDVSVTWASGTSNFDKTWTARASYSYS